MTDRTGYKSRVVTVRGRARAQLSAIRKERLARRRVAPDVPETGADAAWTRVAVVGSEAPDSGWSATPESAAPSPEMAETAEPVPTPAAEVATAADRPADAAAFDELMGRESASDPVAPVTEVVEEENLVDHEEPGVAEPAAAMTEAMSHGTDEARDTPSAPEDAAPDDPAPDEAATDEVPPTLSPLMMPEISEPEPAPSAAAETGPVEAPDRAAPGAAAEARAAAPDVNPDNAPQERQASPDDETEPMQGTSQGATDLHAIPGIGPGLVWMFQSAGVASLDDLAHADTSALSDRLGLIARLLDLDHFVAQARMLTEQAAPR